MTKEKNIHEGHRKRLRQSVDNNAEMDALSDIEVLEYLLTFLIPRKDTNPIAHALLDSFGSIYGVLSASSQELFAIKNMTNAAAHLLPNITAIVRRAGASRIKSKTSIKLTEQAISIFKPYFLNRHTERLYMASIDLHDRLMQVDLLSEGSSSYTSVDFSKILGIVSRVKPEKILLAHNHPGGSLLPSNDDISLTESLSTILTSLKVKLIDHIIFTDDDYFSFYENNITLEHVRKVDMINGTNYYKEIRNRKEPKRYLFEGEKDDQEEENTDLNTDIYCNKDAKEGENTDLNTDAYCNNAESNDVNSDAYCTEEDLEDIISGSYVEKAELRGNKKDE